MARIVYHRRRASEPNVFVRVVAPWSPSPPDSDKALATLWVSAIFPNRSGAEIQRAARAALRRAR